MNIERLAALEEHLRNAGDSFNLRYIHCPTFGADALECGFVACIVGHAAFLNKIEFSGSTAMWNWFIDFYKFSPQEDFDLASWCYFNLGTHYRWMKDVDKVTAEDAADLIQYIRQEGCIPEDVNEIAEWKARGNAE